MRKLVVTEFMTLDGVMEAPEKWSFPYWNDEIAKFKHEELFASDALLLGRVTYEGFAEAWPDREDEEGYAERMNNLPKYVVSNSLEKVEWNNARLLRGDVAEEVARLKETDGKDILVYGSGELVNALLQKDLVDQYHVLLYPIVLGKGKKLFRDGGEANLHLTKSKTFPSGVVLLTYQPAK